MKMEITILTSKAVFRAQKSQLSEHSEYFRAMFSHSLMRENQTETVDLSQSVVTATGFRCVLQYINLGVLDMRITDLDEVLTTVDYLLVSCIQDLLYLNVWQHTNATNFAEIWNSIMKWPHSASFDYKLSIDIFIQNNFCLELIDQHLSQLYRLDVDQIRYILQEIPLKCVESEYEIFQIVLKWLQRRRNKDDAYEVISVFPNIVCICKISF